MIVFWFRCYTIPVPVADRSWWPVVKEGGLMTLVFVVAH